MAQNQKALEAAEAVNEMRALALYFEADDCDANAAMVLRWKALITAQASALAEARERIERLTGCKFSERVYDAMKSRAEKAEAALRDMRDRDERNGSLHPNYRAIIDAALPTLPPAAPISTGDRK